MPRAVLIEVEECLKESGICVTCLEAFNTVCLDKNILYTALVMMHTVRGDKVETPITNCSYRLAAYHQFTNWTYNFLGKGNRRVVPTCVVNVAR